LSALIKLLAAMAVEGVLAALVTTGILLYRAVRSRTTRKSTARAEIDRSTGK
jgi:hypothetical protein